MIKEIIVFIGYRSRVQKRGGVAFDPYLYKRLHILSVGKARSLWRAIPASAKFRGYASVGRTDPFSGGARWGLPEYRAETTTGPEELKGIRW